AYEAAGVDELVITFVDALELTTIQRYAQEFLHEAGELTAEYVPAGRADLSRAIRDAIAAVY
ncbi:hypothetical protein ABT262_49970, partial [Amycolatopsis mediterranei]